MGESAGSSGGQGRLVLIWGKVPRALADRDACFFYGGKVPWVLRDREFRPLHWGKMLRVVTDMEARYLFGWTCRGLWQQGSS